ncbi:MAG: ParB/RepB/Spo0J family partition protein [Bacteriovoracaceae bacterium]|nr:ParB/RepB/Spo0J family partition protein [Bacteriovoracaceae bacterium]
MNMQKKPVLGKGMAALLGAGIVAPPPVTTAPTTERKIFQSESQENAGVLMVPLEKIVINPHQPRKVFKEEDLKDLSESIRENGIIQPITVSHISEENKFELIAGERRFRAAKMAGLEVVPVIVKRVTKRDKLVMAIIENVQRSNLNCVEESLAYFQLMEEFKLTQEEVAKKIGKERSVVANFLRILKLPREVIIFLQKEQLSLGHAKVLGSIKDDELVVQLSKEAVEHGWSVRDLEAQLESARNESLDEGATPRSAINADLAEFKQQSDGQIQRLERKTGLKFKIKGKSFSKGQIQVRFNSEAEFQAIMKYFLP